MEKDAHADFIAGPSATKQKGVCPFCLKIVSPSIVEVNYIRRDQCQCPECKETIYLCRTLGCHDFAKGTSVYDHELCPSCTDTASNVASEVGKAALKIAVAVGSGLLLAALKKDDKK